MKVFIFKCLKCLEYTEVVSSRIEYMPHTDCPSCGEDGFENWLLWGLAGRDRRRKNRLHELRYQDAKGNPVHPDEIE